MRGTVKIFLLFLYSPFTMSFHSASSIIPSKLFELGVLQRSECRYDLIRSKDLNLAFQAQTIFNLKNR